MEYSQARKETLQWLNLLQQKGFSYQSICDYINSQQVEFVLYKDFFTRFQSKLTHFSGLAKREKLSLIHQYVQNFYFLNFKDEDTFHELLANVISTAASVKFKSYLNVNHAVNLIHSGLSEYYNDKSPAYHFIINSLKHKKQYEWVLDVLNHASTFKILSFKVSRVFSQNAVVTTEEFWKLFWVDKITKKLEFRYDSLGHHIYLLSKDENGSWKIIENMEKTSNNKREPEYIDYSMLEKIVSNNWEVNKITALEFIASNDLLHGIEFIKISFRGKLNGKQISILDSTKKSYLNSYRLLNTNVINHATFNAEIESLNTQVKLLCTVIFMGKM